MSEWEVSLGGLRSGGRAFLEHCSELGRPPGPEALACTGGPGWVLAKSTRCGALASKVTAHLGAS